MRWVWIIQFHGIGWLQGTLPGHYHWDPYPTLPSPSVSPLPEERIEEENPSHFQFSFPFLSACPLTSFPPPPNSALWCLPPTQAYLLGFPTPPLCCPPHLSLPNQFFIEILCGLIASPAMFAALCWFEGMMVFGGMGSPSPPSLSQSLWGSPNSY